jgi:sialate O-acetylesterase
MTRKPLICSVLIQGLLATCLAGAAALGLAPCARADVKLPALFSDHMVLQRDTAAPVWGWAEPGEEVTVSVGGQAKTAKADAAGQWSIRLDALKAGGPLTLTVKGKNTLTVSDVLVGEVWLGSGQSNMALAVSGAKDYEQEKAAANLPQIRMFAVATNSQREPQADCKGDWQVCSPETVGKFSATAYFFGREVHQALGTPVGLIKSCVGGTPIESWISPEAQRNSPELKPFFEAAAKTLSEADRAAAKARYEKALAQWKEESAKAKAEGRRPAGRAPVNPEDPQKRKGDLGGLFNGMIAPLVPYALRGAIWYQGEANSTPEKAPLYQVQLPLLVQDWRTRWGEGDFPFAWVQLPNFSGPGRNWPLVREAMLKALKVPNTGMAITIDIGEPGNIHPKNKQDVGKRLAMWALGTVYGRRVATSGPLPAGHKVEGSTVVISFAHTDGGLAAGGGDLKGFEIAGADKKFVPAAAKIVGDTVVVSSPQVREPAAVRYAWANNPECNLFSGAGLPASPFRTDDWPADAQP